MKSLKLDSQERKILKEYGQGKYVAVEHVDKEIKLAKEAAKDMLQKTKNVNIRLSVRDIQEIKEKAAENSLPYQTLIATIIRQYTRGAFTLTL